MNRPNLRDLDPGWERIIAESFGRRDNPDRFDELMRKDPEFRPSRVWFIVETDSSSGHLVATAGAWSSPVWITGST